MSKRLCFSITLLSILLSSAPSSVHTLNAGSRHTQNSTVPQLTLNITDWWNAPVVINRVRMGEQEVSTGSAIVATDDWAKHLSIEAINKSQKTISYIAYAIDFTVAGEDKLYRLRLQDGNLNAFPDALTAPGGLRVLRDQKHHLRFTDNAWGCHSTLVGMINERKTRILKVDLFVESVGFTDDTLWMFGSRLKRNKETSIFENVELREISKGKNQQSASLARGFLAKGTSAKSYPLSGCCAPTMNYTSGGAKAVQVLVSCSSCPPQAGGGSCPPPVPFKTVNSLSGGGPDGINQIAFTNC